MREPLESDRANHAERFERQSFPYDSRRSLLSPSDREHERVGTSHRLTKQGIFMDDVSPTESTVSLGNSPLEPGPHAGENLASRPAPRPTAAYDDEATSPTYLDVGWYICSPRPAKTATATHGLRRTGPGKAPLIGLFASRRDCVTDGLAAVSLRAPSQSPVVGSHRRAQPRSKSRRSLANPRAASAPPPHSSETDQGVTVDVLDPERKRDALMMKGSLGC